MTRLLPTLLLSPAILALAVILFYTRHPRHE